MPEAGDRPAAVGRGPRGSPAEESPGPAHSRRLSPPPPMQSLGCLPPAAGPAAPRAVNTCTVCKSHAGPRPPPGPISPPERIRRLAFVPARPGGAQLSPAGPGPRPELRQSAGQGGGLRTPRAERGRAPFAAVSAMPGALPLNIVTVCVSAVLCATRSDPRTVPYRAVPPPPLCRDSLPEAAPSPGVSVGTE